MLHQGSESCSLTLLHEGAVQLQEHTVRPLPPRLSQPTDQQRGHPHHHQRGHQQAPQGGRERQQEGPRVDLQATLTCQDHEISVEDWMREGYNSPARLRESQGTQAEVCLLQWKRDV